MADKEMDAINRVIRSERLRAVYDAPRLKQHGICPSCGKFVWRGDLRDDVSLTEYGISGLCQKCQDEYHGQ